MKFDKRKYACPHCLLPIRGLEGVKNKDAIPDEYSVTVCLECGQISQFVREDGELKLMTARLETLQEVFKNKELAAQVLAIKMVHEKRRKEFEQKN